MKYSYVVSKIDLPEYETGEVSYQQSFEELDDAMSLVDELNDDCEYDDHWYEVIVQAVIK